MFNKLNSINFSWKEVSYLIAIFALYLFSYSNILLLDTTKAYVGLFLKSILSTLILYFIVTIVTNRVVRICIVAGLAVLYSMTLYLNTKFGSISTGIISATLDTNPAEAIEYLSTSGVSWQLLMFIPFLIITEKAKVAFVTVRRVLILPLAGISLLFCKNAYVSETPSDYMVNIFSEIKMLSLVKETLELRELENRPIYPEWSEVSIKDEDFNYVVIIGESAQKKAFHFYGNEVKTTEPISDLNGWTIVADPIAPATQTRYSVIRLLSDNDKKEVNQNLNIIDLAKMAGLKTYWFSNQGSFGAHDTPVTRLGKRADEYNFHNLGFVETKNDNVLIDDLRKGLVDDSSARKVFFLHTIGSHVDFCERLENANMDLLQDTSSNPQIDCYNNSIYQTIGFIKEIQTTFNRNNLKYKIVYLSDHGLVDIDEPPYKTHGAGHFFKKEAVEVPFFFVSDGEEKGSIIDKTYYLRDFPHTFAQWAGITATQIKPEKAVESDLLSQEQYVIDHAQAVRYFD